MKNLKTWGSLAVATLLLVFGFQNCSPVAFKNPEAQLASTNSVLSTDKMCALENKKEGELWLAQAGQERVLVACSVGVGNQFNVFNVAKEYRCTNGSAVLTGKTERSPAGKEGLCDVNCGKYQNGDLWLVDMGTSKETLACPTSVSDTSTLTYSNSAQYKCTNAIASATGVVEKKKISETPCPTLSFNDQDNQATLAYEDTHIDADSDYNDFVTNIKVVETYSSIGELNKIVIEYAAKKKVSGAKHKFIGVFDGTVRGRDGWVSNQNLFKSEAMFVGDANIKYELYSGGVLTSTADNVSKNADLIIFDDTFTAVNKVQVARITITGLVGKSNLLSVRKGLSIKRYRTVLYVVGKQTKDNYDVDISDINPSSYDNNGKSLGFFVPVNWKSPQEGTNISLSYPDFAEHAKFMKDSIQNSNLVESDKGKNWFKNVISAYVD